MNPEQPPEEPEPTPEEASEPIAFIEYLGVAKEVRPIEDVEGL